ncbi:hypothetical protein KCU87_g511, partial [Aureobasidium melanogenum]
MYARFCITINESRSANNIASANLPWMLNSLILASAKRAVGCWSSRTILSNPAAALSATSFASTTLPSLS